MSKKSIRLAAVVCLLGWTTLEADFVEDFESYEVHAFLDSLPNWTTVVFGNANTEVTGGDFFIETVNGSVRLNSPRGGGTIAVVNADVLTLAAGADFELFVDVYWNGVAIGNGPIFCYQDQSNFYFLEMIAPNRADTGFNLKKRVNGAAETIVGLAPADLVLNTEYRMHVQYKAGPNTFEVWLETLDDGLVQHRFSDIVDDTFRGGQIGVWSNSSFNGKFDNLTLMKAAEIAESPDPANDASDVARDSGLSWTPGQFASTHDVYFGTQLDDVNDASRANPLNVLVSQGQSDTSFDPAGVLEFGQTYFWRVDEVNSAPDFAVFKGGIWSFTAEPLSIPITQLTVTASSSFGDSVPEKTINGSGLADDRHGTGAGDMWISAGIPATIEYAFDRAYKLHEMWIWNSNQTIETFIGFGAKDVVIEHSLDGENWTVLEGVGPLAQAPGTAGYAHNNTIGFGGVTTQHVRMTINSVQGFAPQASLSEVRFFSIPTTATRPSPDSGATDVAPDLTLSWGRNGREADSHEVYIGTDANDLSLAGRVMESSFETQASDLRLGQTYYWQVVEVNDAETPTEWAGDVWSFTTVETIVIDDMESYKDEEFFEIWATWIDGFDDPGNNGAVVGANPALGNFSPESSIVHGGAQSLPFHYDNSGAPRSEAKRTFDAPMDWTGHSVQGLVLYFQGSPSNTGGNLYVKINDTKVAYDGEASNLMRLGWNKWYISLADVSGTNLSRVTSLTIGIDGGGAGLVYVDDISLTPDAREIVTPTEPSAEALVAHYTFDGDASDRTGQSPGTLFGFTSFVPGVNGEALNLDGIGAYVAIDGLFYNSSGMPEVTVTVWIRTDVEGNQIIASFDRNEYWRLEINGDGGGPGQVGWDVWTDTGQLDSGSSSRVDDNEWHHVAGVFDNGTATIYIDGHPEPSATGGSTFGTGNTRFGYVGLGSESTTFNADPRTPASFFAGDLDDVRIYQRALSVAEVAWLTGRTEPFDAP